MAFDDFVLGQAETVVEKSDGTGYRIAGKTAERTEGMVARETTDVQIEMVVLEPRNLLQ